MPSIRDLSVEVTEFPNKFSSPFGVDGIIPLYSSIPITGVKTGLPCLACSGSGSRQQVIEAESLKYPVATTSNVVNLSS